MNWLPVVRDIVVTVAAAVTAIAAWRGLSVWKRELHTRRIVERSTTLLEKVLELRDLITRVRDPFMGKDEISVAIREIGATRMEGEGDSQFFERSARIATLRRRNSVVEALNAVRASSVPVEAALGTDAISSIDALRSVVNELIYSFDTLASMDSEEAESGQQADELKELRTECRDRIRRRQNGDFFGGQIDEAIKAVENQFRKQIGP